MKGTIHWVSAAHAEEAEVRLYDRLFTSRRIPGTTGSDPFADLNPDSLEVLTGCKVEPVLAGAPGDPVSVRAAGILLRRPRLTPRRAGLQPHGDAEGQWAKIQKRASVRSGGQAEAGPLRRLVIRLQPARRCTALHSRNCAAARPAQSGSIISGPHGHGSRHVQLRRSRWRAD